MGTAQTMARPRTLSGGDISTWVAALALRRSGSPAASGLASLRLTSPR